MLIMFLFRATIVVDYQTFWVAERSIYIQDRNSGPLPTSTVPPVSQYSSANLLKEFQIFCSSHSPSCLTLLTQVAARRAKAATVILRDATSKHVT
jgi:hypothetical protein